MPNKVCQQSLGCQGNKKFNGRGGRSSWQLVRCPLVLSWLPGWLAGWPKWVLSHPLPPTPCTSFQSERWDGDGDGDGDDGDGGGVGVALGVGAWARGRVRVRGRVTARVRVRVSLTCADTPMAFVTRPRATRAPLAARAPLARVRARAWVSTAGSARTAACTGTRA